jgi:CubicO group peptidase (beta-lactamase class C family)
MRNFVAAGDDIAWVAFAPGAGSHFSVVASNGQFFNRNIPDECHQKMGELSANGAKIVCVAFPPGGGNSWSIVNDHGAFFNRNIPDECHQKMGELSANGAKIVCVAFPPGGGNSWSIVNDHGAFFNRNIPDECHQMMGQLSKGAKIHCVAFPPGGGNSWSVVNDQGAYFNRNIDDEAHMYFEYFTEVYGPVRVVAFDPNGGGGWSVTAAATKHEVVCDATQCAAIADVYDNIANRLNGNVVGYACTVGRASIGAYSHGYARTNANTPARLFLPSTKIPMASVSKVVTTLTAIPVLAKNQVSLDSGIGGHLPPDWNLDPYVASITFRQFLQHRSGIKDYGNKPQDYDSLKAFFTQKVNPNSTSTCQNPTDAINPNDHNPCYSNYNFAIFRILLPWINKGFVDNPANRGPILAAEYIKLAQKYVFEPVGAIGVDAKPPASGPQHTAYAFSYAYPGTNAGVDWGDDTAGVGAAGWYLAIDDAAKVLFSLNANDGRILTSAQLHDMETTQMGWDVTSINGYRWVEKNGGWGSSGTTISTSIAMFGPGVYGALFLNSDVSGPGLQNNWKWCKNCETMVYAGGANAGHCPAGGNHDTSQGSNYLVPLNSPSAPGQSNWRWCNKCQALSFGGGAAGPCSAGGQHDHTGSGNYTLQQNVTPVPADTQDQWKWCQKCHVLAYSANAASVCAAGGAHDYTGSGNYAIAYQVDAATVLREAYFKALTPKSASAGAGG